MQNTPVLSPISRAIAQIGLSALAAECGVSHQAVRKWERVGRMPWSEFTGKTTYTETIQRLCNGHVTKAELLAMGREPVPESPALPQS